MDLEQVRIHNITLYNIYNSFESYPNINRLFVFVAHFFHFQNTILNEYRRFGN